MSLTFSKGDIFEAGVDALVNPVNCIGVMGAGLAAKFKARFPDNFLLYSRACSRHHVCLGDVFITSTGQLIRHHWIINFPTKRHYADKSEACWIATGLASLISAVDQFKIKSMAVPALGCGLGGLDWNTIVKPLMTQAFGQLKPDIFVFEPFTPQ